MSSDSKQQQAIADYLQALLEDVAEEPVELAVVEEPKPKVVGLEKLIETVPETLEETRQEVRLEQPVEEPEAVEPVEVVVQQQEETIVAEVLPETPIEKSESLVPEWGAEPFQCLLFKVAGLTWRYPLLN